MTRRTVIALAACVLAAGCDDNATTAPSNVPTVFTAILSPANEVPPVSNSEAGGRGAAQIDLTVTRDAGNVVTGATATFYFQLSGFPNGTTTTGAHIHPGAAGTNGPVIVSTGGFCRRPCRAVGRGHRVSLRPGDGRRRDGSGDHQQPGRVLLQRAFPSERRGLCAGTTHTDSVGRFHVTGSVAGRALSDPA